MKRVLRIFLKVLYVLWVTVKAVFILYAIIFSLAATVGLYLGYRYVTAPLRQVTALKTRNPVETAYMAHYRTLLGPGESISCVFVPFDSISNNLKNAVLAAEDDGFYTHPGFDIVAMLSALEYNRAAQSIKRGGSTITQQLAKNLFLSSEKSWERKYKELGYTVLLEKYLGKKRILELYLNYAQWGKKVFGCEAASRLYFKKSCRNLSPYEAARLAAVLSMPNRASPLNVGSAFIGQRIAVIANNLYLHRQIDDSGYVGLTGSAPPGKDSTLEPDSTQDEDAANQ